MVIKNKNMQNENQQALDQDVVNLAKAIRKKESNHNFNAVGDNGSSYGAYQWQKPTWQTHAKIVLGDMNAEPTPENQNKVAYGIMKQWKDDGLNPAQIAAKWNSGSEYNWENKIGYNERLGVNYNVPEYVNEVYNEYKNLKQSQLQNTQNIPIINDNKPQEKKRSIAGGIIQNIAQGIVKPFAKIGGAIAGTGRILETLPEINSPDYLQKLSDVEKRNKEDINLGEYLGKYKPLKTMEEKGALKEALGTGIEAGATIAPTGSLTSGTKALLGGKLAGKPILQGGLRNALEGAITSGAASTGAAIAENKKLPEALSSITSSTLLGGGAGFGLGLGSRALSKIPQKVSNIINPEQSINNITNKSSDYLKKELNKLTDKYAVLGKIKESARSKGYDPIDLISKADFEKEGGLFKNAVDSDGTITTLGEGGVRERYYDKYVSPIENVVTKNIENEGTKIPLGLVKKRLLESIDSVGLKGKTKISAQRNIEDEIQGLALDADKDGYIPLKDIQLAKIDKYRNINFMDPSSKLYDKTVANTYKSLVEKYVKGIDVEKVNKEIGNHLQALKLIEKLDGRKVEGGKLGKYFAQMTGGLIGSHFGPLGSAIGSEVAGNLKGKSMQQILKGGGGGIEMSPELIQAIQKSKTKTINLPGVN